MGCLSGGFAGPGSRRVRVRSYGYTGTYGYAGTDGHAGPTATPAPPPTATPVPPAPTNTPEPEEEPAAMNPLEKLVITPATTGRDLFGVLSEEETACIEAAIGEAFFGMMMDAPLMQATSNVGAAAPIFGCIEEDNLILLGVAFMEAQGGGWGRIDATMHHGVGKGTPGRHIPEARVVLPGRDYYRPE